MAKRTRTFSLIASLSMLLALSIFAVGATGGTAQAQALSNGQHTPFIHIPLHKLANDHAVHAAKKAGGVLPTWSSSFSFSGKSYPYTMVGTDPHAGSATTTIPVDIVPLKFVFAGGTVSDGSSVTSKITTSPLFQNAHYNTGDTTQYADAIQRSEFWSSVSTKSQNYHVLLGTPVVHPAATLNVPAASGLSFGGVGYVDVNWFSPLSDQLAVGNGLSPDHLTIFAAADIYMYQGSILQCCIGGYHTAVQSGGSNYTYAYASYNQSNSIFGSGFSDVEALSHEIAEWANDPLTNNTVPNWSVASQPQYGCNNYLEVGDPLVGTDFTIGSYHLQDEASFSWFAHESPSQAFQGKYSYLGTFTSPATTC